MVHTVSRLSVLENYALAGIMMIILNYPQHKRPTTTILLVQCEQLGMAIQPIAKHKSTGEFPYFANTAPSARDTLLWWPTAQPELEVYSGKHWWHATLLRSCGWDHLLLLLFPGWPTLLALSTTSSYGGNEVFRSE